MQISIATVSLSGDLREIRPADAVSRPRTSGMGHPDALGPASFWV
jgi:hypothetical protein